MFGVIERYLLKVFAFALLFSVLLFLSLDVLFAVLAELNDIGGNYSIGDVFYYVILTIPGRVYELFPLSAVVAVVVGLGSLAAGSELVVMRASGMSQLRIARSVLLSVAGFLAVVMMVGEFVSPAGEKMANTFRAQEISEGQGVATDYSVWIRDGSVIFNAQRLIKGRIGNQYELQKVTVFEFDEFVVKKISRADSAVFDGEKWLLTNLEVSVFSEKGVVLNRFAERQWKSRIKPEILNISLIRPKDLGLRDIKKLQKFAGKDQELLSAYQVAWWSKCFFPFFVLTVAFTGVPFVFGGMRSGGFAQRLIVGVMLGIILYLINKTLLNLGEVYHIHPFWVVVMPSVMIFFVVFLYLVRVDGRRC